MAAFMPAAKAATAANIFETRQPFLRPSIVFGFVGLLLLLIKLNREGLRHSPRTWAAVVLVSLPIVTLSQQAVTGRAILPQNWELSGNYICLVAGYGLFLGSIEWVVPRFLPPLAKYMQVVVWLGLLFLVVCGEILNERDYFGPNADSVAYAKVFERATKKIGRIDRVVLPHLWDESLFLTRTHGAVDVLGGYDWLLSNSPPVWKINSSFSSHAAAAEKNFDMGFETLARRGLTVEAFRESMAAEVQQDNCWPTLMYFFSLLDCWPTSLNYTSPTHSRLPSTFDSLANMYAQYLRRGKFERGITLLITRVPVQSSENFENELVATFEDVILGKPIRAFAYLQRPRF